MSAGASLGPGDARVRACAEAAPRQRSGAGGGGGCGVGRRGSGGGGVGAERLRGGKGSWEEVRRREVRRDMRQGGEEKRRCWMEEEDGDGKEPPLRHLSLSLLPFLHHQGKLRGAPSTRPSTSYIKLSSLTPSFPPSPPPLKEIEPRPLLPPTRSISLALCLFPSSHPLVRYVYSKRIVTDRVGGRGEVGTRHLSIF